MSAQTLTSTIYKHLFHFLNNEDIQCFLLAAVETSKYPTMKQAAHYHFHKRLNTCFINAPKTTKSLQSLFDFLVFYGTFIRDLTIIYTKNSVKFVVQQNIILTGEKSNRLTGDWCKRYCPHTTRLTLNLKKCDNPNELRLPCFEAMESLTILHANISDARFKDYFLSALPPLKQLQFIANDVSDGGFLNGLVQMDIHPTRMRLDLFSLNIENFERFACQMHEYQELRELHLVDNAYKTDVLAIKWCLFHPGLREASVPVGLAAANTQQLCAMLRQLPALQRLNLTIRPEDGTVFDRIVRPVGENASSNLRTLCIRLLQRRPDIALAVGGIQNVHNVPKLPAARPCGAQLARQQNRYSAYEWSADFRPCRHIRALWLSAQRPLDELLISVPQRFPDLFELRLVDVLCPLRWDSLEQYLRLMEPGAVSVRLHLQRVRIQVLGDEELDWNEAGSRLAGPDKPGDECTRFLAAIDLYVIDYAVALQDMCLKKNIILYTDDLCFV